MTDDEWFTPRSLIELVRQVLGGIDTDPASAPAAQTVVQAATHYTVTEDGLSRPWHGRTFVNPPYSHPAPWISKLLDELDSGRVTEAIALVNARTSSRWWQALAARAWRCDIRGRVLFWRPERPEGSAGRVSSVAFYIGPNARRFAKVFRPLGAVTSPAAPICDTKACVMCGASFPARRSDAATCSPRCRKSLERSRKSGAMPPRAA